MANGAAPGGIQPFPNLEAPLVSQDGLVTINWYQFLLSLWARTGGNVASSAITPTTMGAKGQTQTLAASPFMFTSGLFGAILVTRPYAVDPAGNRRFSAGGETIEFSRNGTDWFLAGTAPRQLFLLAGDQVRVSWFTTQAPEVVFFPVATS